MKYILNSEFKSGHLSHSSKFIENLFSEVNMLLGAMGGDIRL